MIICNLQKTPKDGKAEVLIHTKADDLMREVMKKLDIPIPVYRRTDTVRVSVKKMIMEPKLVEIKSEPTNEALANSTNKSKYLLQITYPNGVDCAFVKTVQVLCGENELGSSNTSPFRIEWMSDQTVPFDIKITLYFTKYFNQKMHTITHSVDPQKSEGTQEYTFDTAIIDYNEETTTNGQVTPPPENGKRPNNENIDSFEEEEQEETPKRKKKRRKT